MSELKPCPFCGGEAELIIVPGCFKSGLSSSGWLVKCLNGCCNQTPYMSDHDAVEAWNRRVNMNEQERIILNLADTLEGEINRMCVTKELSELDTMYGHAKKNLDKLSKIIYESRFKEGEG